MSLFMRRTSIALRPSPIPPIPPTPTPPPVPFPIPSMSVSGLGLIGSANGGKKNVSPVTGLPCSVPRVKKVSGQKKCFCWYTDQGELECPGCCSIAAMR